MVDVLVLVSAEPLSPVHVCPIQVRYHDGRPSRVPSRARTAWVASVPVPPAFLREALSASGLRPSDLAPWAAKLDPWVGLGALRLDRRWDNADRREARDRVDARFVAEQGRAVYPFLTEAAAAGAGSAPDPAVAEVFLAYKAEMDALSVPRVPPELALALAASDDPDLSNQALLSLFDIGALPLDRARALMLDRDTAPDVRDVALKRWCAIAGTHPLDVRLTPAEFAKLRAVVTAEPDAALATGLALFGVTQAQAVRPEDPALVEAWAKLASDVADQCHAYGPYHDLAASPPLRFDELPPAFRPDGFAALAAGVGGGSVTLDRIDCAQAPCIVWFSGDRRTANADLERDARAALAAWQGSADVDVLEYDEERVTLVGMPLPPDVATGAAGRWLRWRAQAWTCPDDLAIDEANAIAGTQASPSGWAEALGAAVESCWRSLRDPASSSPIAVFHGGRWQFDADDPLWACTADQVGPPAPPDGARARVTLGFTGVLPGQ